MENTSDPLVLVGVSFGGVVAAEYAGRHPERVRALVVAASPSPRWKPTPMVTTYLRRPWLSVPAFAVRGASHLLPEVFAALPWPSAVSFTAAYLYRIARWPMMPARMTGWVQEWLATDVAAACARITAPTLVVTGEPRLDRVVPTESTLDYLRLVPGAVAAQLPRTGHIGVVSQPAAFARLVKEFVDAHAH